MATRRKSPELGLGVCIDPDCGAQVMYWENVRGTVFYSCRGAHDPEGKFCGDRHEFGPPKSLKLKQTLGAKKDDIAIPKTDGLGSGTEPEPGSGPKPERGLGRFLDLS